MARPFEKRRFSGRKEGDHSSLMPAKARERIKALDKQGLRYVRHFSCGTYTYRIIKYLPEQIRSLLKLANNELASVVHRTTYEHKLVWNSRTKMPDDVWTSAGPACSADDAKYFSDDPDNVNCQACLEMMNKW